MATQSAPPGRGFRSWRPGAISILVTAFVILPALIGIGYYRIHPAHSDFMLYYRDARIGWTFGWSHVYDLGDFRAMTQQLGIHGSDQNSGSLSLPILTWLVAPYALLPMPLAYAAWFVTLAGVVGLTWLGVAPTVGWGKWSHLALAVVFLPLVFAMTLGSAVVLAFAAVAWCWSLSRQGHTVLAGFVLSLTMIRPQVVLLLPLCLLAAGRYRVVIGFVAGVAAVAAVTLLTIPVSSLEAYARLMGGVAQHPSSWQVASDLTITSVRPWPVAVVLVIAISAVALWISFLARRDERGDGMAIVAGVLGSLLVTPYIHRQDLTMLLLAVWLCLRWMTPRWWPAVVIPVSAIANFDLSVHTALPVLLVAGSLIALLIDRIRADSHASVLLAA